MKSVPVDGNHPSDAVLINPNGETGVIQCYSKYPLAWGTVHDTVLEYQYGAIGPGREVGDEIQLQIMVAANRRPIAFYHVLNGGGINISGPVHFYDGRGEGRGQFLRFPVPGDTDHHIAPEDPPLPEFETPAPVPHVAVLRWTGAYWLVIAATVGVVIRDDYPHI